MSAARVTRWSRVHVAAGVLSLVAWQVGDLVGLPHRAAVTLAVHGFVLNTVFGKAYALVPSYFDRSLSFPRAPAASALLAGTGTVLLAASRAGVLNIGGWGGRLWAAGALVAAGTLVWTVRDNLTGAETATGEHDVSRARTDRLANAAVPVALAYLLVGALGTAFPGRFLAVGLPPAAVLHLLAAGVAALLVFAVGLRLFPRLGAVPSPPGLPWILIPAGVVGPALLAAGLGGIPVLPAGAVLEATAVLAFTLLYATLRRDSDRDRVGLGAPLLGGLAGSAGVALGLRFAFLGLTPGAVQAHFRLNVGGFLALVIVGASYSFYPPSVAPVPRGPLLARAAIASLAGGVGLEALGLLVGSVVAPVAPVGEALAAVGAVLHATLVLGAFLVRWRAG